MRRSRRRDPTRSPTVQGEEAFRVLANNVALAMSGLAGRCVAVTSPAAGEGKTTVAVGLARAMALAGRRVVLVDLDLRHPEAHRRLGTANDEGASDVLCDRRALQGCLRFVEVGTSALGTTRGLYLLPAGPPVPDPPELLGTRRAVRMLAALSEQADVVVVDAAPALPVADTQALARLVGGVILVVDPRRTSAAAARRARDVLARSQARLLGVVINRFEPRRASVDAAYAYGYGYGPDAV